MRLQSSSPDRNVRAIEENFWSLWSRFGEGPGCHLHLDRGIVWFDTPLSGVPYNGVLKTDCSEDIESAMDLVFEHYRQRKVPFWWLVHPSAEPQNLAVLLEARGLTLVETLPGMTLELCKLPQLSEVPGSVQVVEIVTDSDLRDAQEMIAQRWDVALEDQPTHFELSRSFKVGQPGSSFRGWIAKMDGIAVSKALLNIDDGVAGIHGVMTKPEARGRGLARFLTLLALHAGKDSGCDLAMLHSSTVARTLYDSLGFKPVGELKVYASSAMHV